MTIADNQAFPIASSHEQFVKDGLTKRELFASIALQGLLANPNNSSPEAQAVRAVKAADALISALSKEEACRQPYTNTWVS